FPNSFMQAWGILPSLTLTCYHQAGSNYILPIIIYRPAIDTAAANNLGSLRIDVERDGAYVFGVDSLIASFETERSNWGLETIFSSDDLYAFAVKAHYLYTDDGSKVEAQATDTNFPHELGIYIMSSENQTLEIELELNIFADFFAVLNEKCHVDVIGNL
ncbi:MAG: hypothetical protein U9R69_00280, partial [Thermodesulfobacteriota bacterium]|nr:hypothetical protein [Thermodesulfobacteriota bacterium]